MVDEIGNEVRGRVVEVNQAKGYVKMDFNHPLAGKDLHFEGTVLSVRDATSEELEHGHVHGEGGVHH
jgi:FKBP-type peptidyl-prolyl cis-trans isomerase SlyD